MQAASQLALHWKLGFHHLLRLWLDPVGPADFIKYFQIFHCLWAGLRFIFTTVLDYTWTVGPLSNDKKIKNTNFHTAASNPGAKIKE